MAASHGEIAQVQELLGKPREAERSYREGLKLHREIGDKSGMGTSLTNLAALLNENLGRPDEALPLLREALQIRRDAGNANGEALVVNNIGSVYFAKGEYSEAQTYFERALELREKAKVPQEIADTLHNLAETLSKMGRYDQSLSRYVRALELRRSAGDKRGAAIESYSIGTIFDYQSRYGAAIKSKEEALQAFRDLKQRDSWLGEILSGYGNSLSLSGRIEDAAKNLEEALRVAGELQNPSLTAQTVRFQANRLTYSGDIKGANRLAEQASQAAARASDRSLALLAQANVAMTAAPTSARCMPYVSAGPKAPNNDTRFRSSLAHPRPSRGRMHSPVSPDGLLNEHEGLRRRPGGRLDSGHAADADPGGRRGPGFPQRHQRPGAHLPRGPRRRSVLLWRRTICGGPRGEGGSFASRKNRWSRSATYSETFQDLEDAILRLKAARGARCDPGEFQTPAHHHDVSISVPMYRADTAMTQPSLDRHEVRTCLEEESRGVGRHGADALCDPPAADRQTLDGVLRLRRL
jgi:tetratricopeptide (TPR) repeat protein